MSKKYDNSLLPPPGPRPLYARVLTVLLHNLQELNDDLRARPEKHLSLSALFRVSDGLQCVGEHAHPHHLYFRPHRDKTAHTTQELGNNVSTRAYKHPNFVDQWVAKHTHT